MKLAKLPKHLTIGKHTYCVHGCHELHESLSGMCYQTDKTILLDLGQPLPEIEASLWHEILHAFETELNIKLGHRIIKKLEFAIPAVIHQLEYRKRK
jgi:hypothetical protein